MSWSGATTLPWSGSRGKGTDQGQQLGGGDVGPDDPLGPGLLEQRGEA